MHLKLYLEIHYPSEIHANLLEIAFRCHISVRRLVTTSEKTTDAILIAYQCADFAKFGELAGKQNMAIVYHIENPSQPSRHNYVLEEDFPITK